MAILLVFFHHLESFIPVLNQPMLYFQLYVWQGWIGVDLFFVLSGFLITGLLLDSREAENYFSGFYVRRILRIFPLYYLVLIGLILSSHILTSVHAPLAEEVAKQLPLPQDRWTYFCFLTNWVRLWTAQWDATFSSILAHFWSLAIEEQFYLVWPLIVWLARPRLVPWIAGALAAFSCVTRFAWATHIGVQLLVPPVSKEIQLATICRLDGLFIGALCAYFFRNEKIMLRIRRWLPWIATAGIGLFFLVFSLILFLPRQAEMLIYGAYPTAPHSLEDALNWLLDCGGYTLLALGFGALVLLAAYTEDKTTLMQKFLKSRILAPIGKYSYGIYVFHVPILGLLNIYLLPRLVAHSEGEAALNQLAYMTLIAILSFVIPALSYEFFEKRILRLKRNFEPRYASS